MPVDLLIRNVPALVSDALAAQAERHGKSLQVYLLDVLTREAAMLTETDSFQQTSALRVGIPDGLAPESIIREGRDGGFEIDRSELEEHNDANPERLQHATLLLP